GDQLGGLARRGPSRGEEIGERHAVDEIADEIGDGLARHPRPLCRVGRGWQRADFVYGDDGWVPQLGDAAGLAQEAVEVLRPVADVAAARHLDGHGAVKLWITGFEHYAESAVPNLTDNLEAADALPVRRPIRGRNLFQPK